MRCLRPEIGNFVAFKMEKSSRIEFTDDQKEILLKFYSEGMTSTKKSMGDKIRECAAKVAISEEQVKVSLNF